MKSKRDYRLYLKDILDCIVKIKLYTKGATFKKFRQNKMAVDAVVRNFEIIGEATKNLPTEVKSTYRDIPWKEMAGMKDKVIHEYFGIDLEIVWKTIKSRLPELEKLLRKIYNKSK